MLIIHSLELTPKTCQWCHSKPLRFPVACVKMPEVIHHLCSYIAILQVFCAVYIFRYPWIHQLWTHYDTFRGVNIVPQQSISKHLQSLHLLGAIGKSLLVHFKSKCTMHLRLFRVYSTICIIHWNLSLWTSHCNVCLDLYFDLNSGSRGDVHELTCTVYVENIVRSEMDHWFL